MWDSNDSAIAARAATIRAGQPAKYRAGRQKRKNAAVPPYVLFLLQGSLLLLRVPPRGLPASPNPRMQSEARIWLGPDRSVRQASVPAARVMAHVNGGYP